MAGHNDDLELLFGQLQDDSEAAGTHEPDRAQAIAELAASLDVAFAGEPGDRELTAGERAARVAALADGDLEPAAREAVWGELLASPAGFEAAAAGIAFRDTVEASPAQAPADLVRAAMGAHRQNSPRRAWWAVLRSATFLRWSGAAATAVLVLGFGLSHKSPTDLAPEIRGGPAVHSSASQAACTDLMRLALEEDAAAAVRARQANADAQRLSRIAETQATTARQLAASAAPGAEAAAHEAAAAAARSEDAQRRARDADKAAALVHAQTASQPRDATCAPARESR